MKLDPEPRPWEAYALGGTVQAFHPIIPPEVEAVLEDLEADLVLESEEDIVTDTASEGTSGAQGPDPDNQSGPEDPWADVPMGMLFERYTFDFQCLTCDGQVQLSFLAEEDAAISLSTLVDSNRLNPICPNCIAEAEAEAAATSNTPSGIETPPPEDENGGQ